MKDGIQFRVLRLIYEYLYYLRIYFLVDVAEHILIY